MRTFSFSSNESVLSAEFYPPIDLRHSDKEYVLGLLSLEVYNAIPNIDKDNNKFYIGKFTIEIPTGTYDINDISLFLDKEINIINIENNIKMYLHLRPNLNTLKCELKCTEDIDFSKDDSIGHLLGFEKNLLVKDKNHESQKPVDIMKVNVIKVLCNIVTGSYDNGILGHTLHEFFPSVGAGYKIIESPQNVIYLPINTKIIDNIIFKIVDQDGKQLNFRGETITLRAHLKPLDISFENGYKI